MNDDLVFDLVRAHRDVEHLKLQLKVAEARKAKAHDRACELFEHNHWPDAVECSNAIVRASHDWQDGPRLEVIDVLHCPSSGSLVGLDCPRPEATPSLHLAATA